MKTSKEKVRAPNDPLGRRHGRLSEVRGALTLALGGWGWKVHHFLGALVIVPRRLGSAKFVPSGTATYFSSIEIVRIRAHKTMCVKNEAAGVGGAHAAHHFDGGDFAASRRKTRN